jgi:hypothetical protein
MCSTAEGYETRIVDVAEAVVQLLPRMLKERLGVDAGEEFEDAQEVIEAMGRACKNQRRKGKQRQTSSP